MRTATKASELSSRNTYRRAVLFALAPIASVVVGCSSTVAGSAVAGTTLPAVDVGAACPADGIRITTGGTDGAMGLRTGSLHLTNCGRASLVLNGAPTIQLSGADGTVLPITAARGVVDVGLENPPPTPITLRSGATAWAGLSWRNTNVDGDGAAMSAETLQVSAGGGTQPVPVTLHVDLGTTGKFYVTVWRATTS